MKPYLFFTIALFLIHFSNAQLGYTRAQVIAENGYHYETGVADDGRPYFFYITHETSSTYVPYPSYHTYYFNPSGVCSVILVSEPIAQVNSWVMALNNKYVKIADLKWKDYATGATLTITTTDELVNIYFYAGF